MSMLTWKARLKEIFLFRRQRFSVSGFRDSSLTHFRDSFFRKRKALFFHVEAVVF